MTTRRKKKPQPKASPKPAAAPPPAPAPRGRPPEPVPAEQADAVIAWLYEGKSLLSFCAQPGRPKRSTIDDWRGKDADFGARFARARKASGAVLVDMARVAAEDTDEDPARSRIKVDTYLKIAACFCPDEFGQKAQLRVGGDGGQPIKLSGEEIGARVRAIVAAAEARTCAPEE